MGIFQRIKYMIYKYVLPPLIMAVIYLFGLSYRKSIIGRDIEQNIIDKHGHIIYAIWHGRIFFLPYLYRGQKDKVCLASPSIDGEIVAGVLKLFGLEVIRGSSYKEGGRAFRELVRILRQGQSAVIIADGSRGPAFQVQGGVIHLARISGVPVLPLTYSAKRAIIFKSWDRFILPLPFTQVVVMYGEPVYVGKDITLSMIEDKRKELEIKLRNITERADKYFLQSR